MTQQQEQQTLGEIYENVPMIQPSDLELMDMFQEFLKTQPEEIPNLPRGYGQ